MARIRVVRIPEELDRSIEDAAEKSGSTVESFLIFSALFYLELVDRGDIMSHTQEKHLEFIRLAATGMSLRKIGSAIRVSHGTLVGWNRKYAGRISEMCSGEMDQLLEELAEARTQRVAKIARQIRRVEEELQERDLSKISTGTLMRLDLAYRDQLRAEVQPMEIDVHVQEEISPSMMNYLKILGECAVITD